MILTSFDYREMLRWGVCGVLALAMHGGAAMALLAPTEAEEDGEQTGGFVVELAEVPVMRPDVPLDLAPGPDQIESAASMESHAKEKAEQSEEPKPDEEPQTIPPAPEPEAALPVVQKESHEEAQPESQAQNAAPVTQVTQAIAEREGQVAMAPVQAAPKAINSRSLATWKSRMQTIIERNKRYPSAAQARRQTGVVKVAFVVDRSGKLVNARVEQSSGHNALDAEALELLSRVSQFPVPPPELPGETMEVVFPIRFSFR